MTKADIVEVIYNKLGLPRKTAFDIVESMFDIIKEALANGEKVKLSGFGNFILRNKKPRMGRNPQTGQEIEITARRVLVFRPSPLFKGVLLGKTKGEPAAPAEAAKASGEPSGQVPGQTA